MTFFKGQKWSKLAKWLALRHRHFVKRPPPEDIHPAAKLMVPNVQHILATVCECWYIFTRLTEVLSG